MKKCKINYNKNKRIDKQHNYREISLVQQVLPKCIFIKWVIIVALAAYKAKMQI